MKKLKVEKWIVFHAFLMIINSMYALSTTSLSVGISTTFLSFLALIYLNRKELKQLRPYAGYANWITFGRFLLLLLFLCNVDNFSKQWLFLGFLMVIGMDGLDGWAARCYQQSSDWGALFDKEVDSFLVLGISLVLYLVEGLPIWIVGIGLLHYVYELTLYFLGWQYVAIPPNPIGKYVAATLFISLLTPFILPFTIATPILGVASIFTLTSFSISFILIIQNREARAENRD